jgi:hypothetical protein
MHNFKLITWNTRPLVLGIALYAFSTSSMAAPINSYAQASIHVRDCIIACFDGHEISLAFAYQEDRGATGLATAHIKMPPTGTQTAASAGFSSDAFTPTLSAYSYSSGTIQFTTGAFGFQRYEFTSPGTIQIGGKLTYLQSGMTVTDRGGKPEGTVTAGLYTFQMTGNVFDLNDCNVTFPERIVFGKTARICALFANKQVGVGNAISMPTQYNFHQALFNTGLAPVTGGELEQLLSVTGNTGDVFYLAAHLYALSHFDGFADSRNTLRLNIDNPSIVKASYTNDSFVPAPKSAPEPSTAILLLSGLSWRALRKRMKRDLLSQPAQFSTVNPA